MRSSSNLAPAIGDLLHGAIMITLETKGLLSEALERLNEHLHVACEDCVNDAKTAQ